MQKHSRVGYRVCTYSAQVPSTIPLCFALLCLLSQVCSVLDWLASFKVLCLTGLADPCRWAYTSHHTHTCVGRDVCGCGDVGGELSPAAGHGLIGQGIPGLGALRVPLCWGDRDH